jgi:hypothetical protein
MKIPFDIMRIILAILLLVHGVAHLPGFLVPWRLAVLAELPYKTTLLRGAVDVGAAGARMVGLLWLIGALGFVTAAVLVFRGSAAWPALTLGSIVLSLVLCAKGLPETRIRLAVNLTLLAGVALAIRTGWLVGGPH